MNKKDATNKIYNVKAIVVVDKTLIKIESIDVGTRLFFNLKNGARQKANIIKSEVSLDLLKNTLTISIDCLIDNDLYINFLNGGMYDFKNFSLEKCIINDTDYSDEYECKEHNAIIPLRKAIYAGSFDPITLGHLDMIKKGAEQFDELVVAILVNQNKKAKYKTEIRKIMIEKVIKAERLKNVRVEIFGGLVVSLLQQENAKTLLRGIRTSEDFIYEQRLNAINKSLFDGFETVYLISPPELIQCSSSIVRDLLEFRADVSKYVHPSIMSLL